MDHRLEQLLSRYRSVLTGRSAEECCARSRQNLEAWSAQDVAGHLVLSYRSTAKLLQGRIDLGEVVSPARTARQRFLQWVVIERGWFPRGQPAPEFTRPKRLGWHAMCGAELLENMTQSLGAMDAVIAAAAARFGAAPLASHFIFGPLTADQWWQFHAVHGRHHLRQARRALAFSGRS